MTPNTRFADDSVDVAKPQWRKSTLSKPLSNNCVEVAFVGDQIVVRDTKHRNAGALMFDKNEWRAFIDGVRRGEFDA